MEKLVFDAEGLKQKAAGEKRKHKELFKKLKKRGPGELDKLIHPLHEKYMSCMDCLACANCCKSISPAVSDRDVNRIAKSLRVKPSEIVEQYFDLDEDGDYVFREQPCPFLGEDNYCSIYEARPKACREYPHTDRVKQKQILNVTFRNIAVCPVVFEIVEEVRGASPVRGSSCVR